MNDKRLGLAAMGSLLMMAIFASPAAYAVAGTGTLFMYSDSGCTSLLPQAGGIQGYILPSTGTTVYIKITGISESGINVIDLQYSPYVEHLSTTVSGGSTTCTGWTVGTFIGATGVTIGCGVTGIVFYGTTADPNAYQSRSNGGSDGGHFLGAGTNSNGDCVTTTTTSTTTTKTFPPPSQVPEFPGIGGIGFGLLMAAAIAGLVILKKSSA